MLNLPKPQSDQQSLNGHLHRLDLRLKLGAFLYSDRGGDYRSGHSTCSTQSLLGAHKHIRDVLILTQQWQMKDDLQRLCVCSHHYEL